MSAVCSWHLCWRPAHPGRPGRAWLIIFAHYRPAGPAWRGRLYSRSPTEARNSRFTLPEGVVHGCDSDISVPAVTTSWRDPVARCASLADALQRDWEISARRAIAFPQPAGDDDRCGKPIEWWIQADTSLSADPAASEPTRLPHPTARTKRPRIFRRPCGSGTRPLG
jgi:hypothetical protein